MPELPRLAPLEPPFEPSIAEALARRMPKNSAIAPLSLFRLLARAPGLADAMEPLGKFQLRHAPGKASSVVPRDREVVILRACARCRCEYEWGVHVAFFAPRVGLSEEQVAGTVSRNPQQFGLTARDCKLIALVDALHDEGHVSDPLWAELARDFSETELLELLVLAGWYHAIAFVANGAKVPLEEWAPRFPMQDGDAALRP